MLSVEASHARVTSELVTDTTLRLVGVVGMILSGFAAYEAELNNPVNMKKKVRKKANGTFLLGTNFNICNSPFG